MTRGRTALLLTAIGLGLAVPASADAKLRFRNCEEGSCARLSVPLDRSGGVSGRLSLRVELHETFDRPKRGVTLLLAGPPGQAATEVSEYGWEVPGRDLIVFDQRGTGAGALRCRDLEAATETDAGREAAACASLLGERRAFFRTTDTVEDENELIFRVRGRIAGRRVRARVPVHSYFIDAINQSESGGEARRLASRAPRVPNLRNDATGSCRLPLLRDLPGACAHG